MLWTPAFSKAGRVCSERFTTSFSKGQATSRGQAPTTPVATTSVALYLFQGVVFKSKTKLTNPLKTRNPKPRFRGLGFRVLKRSFP